MTDTPDYTIPSKYTVYTVPDRNQMARHLKKQLEEKQDEPRSRISLRDG